MKPGLWVVLCSMEFMIGVGALVVPCGEARELPLEAVGMVTVGMSEADVMARTGPPDQRIDQFEPTPLNQRLVTYQYVWVGDTRKDEWTTTVTFSANTNKVIRISRDRK